MSLRVDLTGNSSGFKAMLAQARLQAKDFSRNIQSEVGSSWGGIGKSLATGIATAFTLEGIKSGIEWFMDTGKEIKDTAEQVEMSAESWQKWSDAVGRAGLSTEGFMRVIETLRQKRTDALTDPKARGELTRLGFSDADITGNMDMSDFTQRALANANKGDLQRGYLSDIIGSRGLKYASALGELPNASAPFTEEDLKEAKELSDVFDKLKRVVTEAALAIFETFASGEAKTSLKDFLLGKTPEETEADLAKARAQAEADWNYKPAVAMRDGHIVKDTAEAEADKKNGTTDVPKPKPDADPLDAKLAEQREEMALHQQERQERLLDSQRDLMTIADRRASIKGELPQLAKQIADRNAKMKGEDFLTDAQKNELDGVTGKAREFAVNELRSKFQDQTDELQLRFNKDRGDLREKQLDFSVDSMSKVGLYSASQVAFNPLVNIGDKTNQLLTQIVHNTTPKTIPTRIFGRDQP